MNANGWIPVWNGPIFCAPLCGGKCTRAAYDLATRRANALANRLGKGWRPCVYENLGWHYSAKKGVANVIPNRRADGRLVDYTLYFNAPRQVVVSGRNPKKLMQLVRDNLRASIVLMDNILRKTY